MLNDFQTELAKALYAVATPRDTAEAVPAAADPLVEAPEKEAMLHDDRKAFTLAGGDADAYCAEDFTSLQKKIRAGIAKLHRAVTGQPRTGAVNRTRRDMLSYAPALSHKKQRELADISAFNRHLAT